MKASACNECFFVLLLMDCASLSVRMPVLYTLDVRHAKRRPKFERFRVSRSQHATAAAPWRDLVLGSFVLV